MKVGFIGAGNMGGALAKAVRKSVPDAAIYLSDFDTEKRNALAKELNAETGDNDLLCRECDFVFLGVKPQVLSKVLEGISATVKARGEELVLISMAAGISLSTVSEGVGTGAKLIRIMPNTPVSAGLGVIVYCTENVEAQREAEFLSLLRCAGLVEKIAEDKIDAASALHGCGPAFVYLYIEALADGAVACGLSRDQAIRFAAATVQGAAKMVLESGKHPGELKDAVCSPGGTTIQGVRALEQAGLRSAGMEAVIAAYEKTVQLGKS